MSTSLPRVRNRFKRYASSNHMVCPLNAVAVAKPTYTANAWYVFTTAAAADGQRLEAEAFVLDSALATTKHSLKLLNLLMAICFFSCFIQ